MTQPTRLPALFARTSVLPRNQDSLHSCAVPLVSSYALAFLAQSTRRLWRWAQGAMKAWHLRADWAAARRNAPGHAACCEPHDVEQARQSASYIYRVGIQPRTTGRYAFKNEGGKCCRMRLGESSHAIGCEVQERRRQVSKTWRVCRTKMQADLWRRGASTVSAGSHQALPPQFQHSLPPLPCSPAAQCRQTPAL